MSAAVFTRIAEGLREILGIVRGDLPCPICHGSRRVCENCRGKSWPDECHCGAGMNCPLCADVPREAKQVNERSENDDPECST